MSAGPLVGLTEVPHRIAHLLAEALPDSWDRAIVEAELGPNSIFVTSLYAPPGGDALRDTGYIDGLDDALMELADVVAQSGNGPYKKCRFTLDRSGQVDVKYDYGAGYT